MKKNRNTKMDKKIIKDNQEITYRELDIYGLPKNSDYIKKEKERENLIKEDGEIIFEINLGVNPKEKILPNMDYQYSEMTNEQKELFEALDCKEDLYEKLEEDFCQQFLGGNDENKNDKLNKEFDDNDLIENKDIEKMVNEENKKIDKENLKNENITKDIKKNKIVKENLNILEEDVETLEGDQINRNDFLKIIEEDAKLLNINLDNNKQRDIKKEKADMLKKIQDKILAKNENLDKIKEENMEDMTPDAILKYQVMNRLPRKNEIILDERVQTAKGGGTIIFRKIKKVKEKIKKKYSYEKEEELNQNPEKIKNLKKLEKKTFDLKMEDDDDFSLDMDDDAPLTKEEIENLQKNYKENKGEVEKPKPKPKQTELVYFRKNKRKVFTKVDELEIEDKEEYINGLKVIKQYGKFKKTPFSKEKDLLIKKMAIVEDEEINIEDRPLLKKLIDEECELAPEEKIIHENYYCMKIVKEDLEVVPVKLRKDKRKYVERVESEKQDLGFLKRNKKETKEEKRERKEMVKKLKNERKLKKREKKETYKEQKRQLIKEKISQKIGNPLMGISVHKLI